MTYVRHYGRLFVTFTCNPKWKEIDDEIFLYLKTKDKPDLLAREFRRKLQKLMDLIKKQKTFGFAKCDMYISVES